MATAHLSTLVKRGLTCCTSHKSKSKWRTSKKTRLNDVDTEIYRGLSELTICGSTEGYVQGCLSLGFPEMDDTVLCT